MMLSALKTERAHKPQKMKQNSSHTTSWQ